MKKSTISIVRESLCQKFHKPPTTDPEDNGAESDDSTSIKQLSFACIRLEALLRRTSPQSIFIILLINLFSLNLDSQIKPYAILGTITDNSGNPLSGVTIQLQGTATTAKSDANGAFSINSTSPNGILQIRLIGYKPFNKSFDATEKVPLKIILQEATNELQEVTIVSNGYQNLNKDKTTGSFSIVDSSLINRGISTGILSRLDGVTSGLLFNRSKTFGTQSDINIRGRSTINGDDKPLIILDNFPYEGDINNINPNDIKSITVLKDAAAAAIWGTRAGNGVIVLTTYKGNYKATQSLNFTSNMSLSPKPDLFRVPWFSADQWIGIEKFLYDKGAYNSAINSGYLAISPAVEIFDQAKKRQISATDSINRINALKPNDVRTDLLKYIYRPAVNQQYALNLSGGSAVHSYFISAGLDQNAGAKYTDNYRRLTLTANQSFKTLKNKLEITTGILFTSGNTTSAINSYSPSSPYEQLIDPSGNSLAVRNMLRVTYADTAGKGKLLDWKYRPLDEAREGRKNQLNSYLINTGLNYNIGAGFKATFLYQFQIQHQSNSLIYDENSYYSRNLINSLSNIDNSSGTAQRIIPIGSISQRSDSKYKSDYARFQLNFDRQIATNHDLFAIAGIEVRNNRTDEISQTLYGLNQSTGTNANNAIDFTRNYPLYYNPAASLKLDAGQLTSYLLDRYVSFYANANYSYRKKYTLSLSARKDESNLFGVKPNQKGVPLYSAGLSWEVNREDFYHFRMLPLLKVRASLGYTGNVSKSISAYLTANAIGNNENGAPFSSIINPPNPALKWERVKILNLGVDFALPERRLSASIEPFLKYGKDLFGTTPLAPQSGVLTYQGNFANTTTKGIDITLNTLRKIKEIDWQSNLIFSIVNSKVTKYSALPSPNSVVVNQSYANPLEGNPYFALYAFRWAGLDSKGDPQVYFNGMASKDYTAINNSLDRSNLVMKGSAVPTVFGSFRNSFTYRQVQLSFNITYRLGYYFRRSSSDNAQTFSTTGFQNATDYDIRWQKPGDELTTNVPNLIYPNNSQRSNAYLNADILVEKGDNIKLQDIRLSWNLRNLGKVSSLFSSLEIYTYLMNVGYIWRANRYGIDPDGLAGSFSNLPAQLSYSFGLKTTF